METADDQSVKCVQSHKNSPGVVNPSLKFCDESRVKSVQIESDVVSVFDSKFPSYMRVVCEHSSDISECHKCNVSKRILVFNEITY
jgi:hypothetical protein